MFTIYLLAGCDFSPHRTPVTGTQNDALLVAHKAVNAYNSYNLQEYLSCFTQDISVFGDHGLGRARIIDGLSELELKYKHVFLRKENRITILNEVRIHPWIYFHQKIESRTQNIEALVGYRIKDGKIKDIMILGEKILAKP